MRRNSGIIGKQLKPSLQSASGVFDTFDNFNQKKGSAWPNVLPSARVSLNATSFNEGQTLQATVYTSGIDIGSTITWKINFVDGNVLSTTDFTALSGSFSVSSTYNNVVSVPVSADNFTEGTETFTLSVSYNNTTLSTSNQFTVIDISTGTPEPQALYAFTSFTFNNANITGAYGPTLSNCLSAYNTSNHPWLNNTDYFNVITSGYQLWTIPATANYQVEVVGAQGGLGYSSGQGAGAPGRGSKLTSTLFLTRGDKLNIIVGHMGSGTGSNGCGGDGAGGGGSFVFTSTGTCLMAAGGGGGGAQNANNRDVTRRDAPNSTSGNKGSGTNGGVGGTNGSGGAGQTGSCVPGGGGGSGILSNGAVGGASSTAGTYSVGFYGGVGAFAGGFGGGGGSGINYAAGGGGGYSGGGGGGLDSCSCSEMGNGGGGGCFSSTTYTFVANAGTSHGYVTITKL
jgi:hypothetical protein